DPDVRPQLLQHERPLARPVSPYHPDPSQLTNVTSRRAFLQDRICALSSPMQQSDDLPMPNSTHRCDAGVSRTRRLAANAAFDLRSCSIPTSALACARVE